MNSILIILTTPDLDEANAIIAALLEKKWIACGSYSKPITSLYLWEGVIEQSEEIEVHLKTIEPLFSQIILYIESVHSYSIPQILKIPIEANKKYLSWMNGALNRT